MKMIRKLSHFIIGSLVILPAFLTAIIFVLNLFIHQNFQIPYLTHISTEIVSFFSDAKTFKNLSDALIYTSLNILFSMGVSTPLGIILGLVLGYSDRIWDYTQPSVDFFRSMPVTFLVPTISLLLGSTSPQIPWLLAVYPCTLFFLINIRNGINGQTLERIHSFKAISGRNSNLQIFFRITCFEILPDIFTGFKQSLSYSIVVITVLEYLKIGGGKGIGSLVADAFVQPDYLKTYSLILFVGVIGFALNRIVEEIQRYCCHWNQKEHSNGE